MEIKSSKGRFTIDNSVKGLKFWNGTGNSDCHVIFSGTLQQVNLALRLLTYKPNQSEYGYDTLVINANDTAAPDTDGVYFMTTQHVDIIIEALNNPPEIHIKTKKFQLSVDEKIVISDLSITDVDAGLGLLSVTLRVVYGRLSLQGFDEIGFYIADGISDQQMEIVASLDAINAALNSMVYVCRFSDSCRTGIQDYITILVDDHGNFGSGGAKNCQDSVEIQVS